MDLSLALILAQIVERENSVTSSMFGTMQRLGSGAAHSKSVHLL